MMFKHIFSENKMRLQLAVAVIGFMPVKKIRIRNRIHLISYFGQTRVVECVRTNA